MPQSTKIEKKKELTSLRKGAEKLFHHMADMPYLVGLWSEEQGNHVFDDAMPAWEANFRTFGICLLETLDSIEACEAACSKLRAKVPDWQYGAGYRDWLDQFDIRGKYKPVQTPEPSQPFEREPNAGDAHHMRGMGIRWDN